MEQSQNKSWSNLFQDQIVLNNLVLKRKYKHEDCSSVKLDKTWFVKLDIRAIASSQALSSIPNLIAISAAFLYYNM